jgi:hypothetical protein
MGHLSTTSNYLRPPAGARRRLPVLVALLLLLALAACTQGASSEDNEAATQVVRSFVAAVEDRDASRIINLIEPADWRKDIGPELRSYVSFLERAEFRNPQYTVIDNTGDLAHIRLVSTMEYKIKGVPSDEQQWDLTFEVVKLDGTWYLRNFDLPAPGAAAP